MRNIKQIKVHKRSFTKNVCSNHSSCMNYITFKKLKRHWAAVFTVKSGKHNIWLISSLKLIGCLIFSVNSSLALFGAKSYLGGTKVVQTVTFCGTVFLATWMGTRIYNYYWMSFLPIFPDYWFDKITQEKKTHILDISPGKKEKFRIL